MGNKKPLEKDRLQGCVRGICLPNDLKDKYLYRKTDKKSSGIVNDNQDEVGFVLDMALKSLGRMSGRLHLLAQIQVTTQAVKAIYYQEGY